MIAWSENITYQFDGINGNDGFLKKIKADSLMQYEYSAEECLEKYFCKLAVIAVRLYRTYRKENIGISGIHFLFLFNKIIEPSPLK